ncbi:hypothetical protein R70006_04367 [Paraburkholderia domus]|jgi:hypothetical protein|uniref:hypothetical protein n=1 Tax=Paraburkholderia domus TaxID=2793075 RepID=UPI001911B9E9|nr:hypothetical protein [Paraburkholderia domus]MBK5049361.1 hypothetical protein [Burkholderia sp. R-70006]CAE6730383.1 hypothetical protein R75483_02172 [Paraburkholderia domus]CAE6780330.1 hypothetical protein R70006_04367 [Paraburkholderia domus]
MSTKHSKKEHLEAAASHHEQAARYHRAASRHFEGGKDYAHAAHEAMMAHGHTLHAIDQAHDAGAHSASTPPGAPASTGSGANSANAAKLHATAAELHDQAAQHMRHAVKLFDQDRSAVAHDAQLALSLALRALSHGNEAARLFVKLAPVEGS